MQTAAGPKVGADLRVCPKAGPVRPKRAGTWVRPYHECRPYFLTIPKTNQPPRHKGLRGPYTWCLGALVVGFLSYLAGRARPTIGNDGQDARPTVRKTRFVEHRARCFFHGIFHNSMFQEQPGGQVGLGSFPRGIAGRCPAAQTGLPIAPRRMRCRFGSRWIVSQPASQRRLMIEAD